MEDTTIHNHKILFNVNTSIKMLLMHQPEKNDNLNLSCKTDWHAPSEQERESQGTALHL